MIEAELVAPKNALEAYKESDTEEERELYATIFGNLLERNYGDSGHLGKLGSQLLEKNRVDEAENLIETLEGNEGEVVIEEGYLEQYEDSDEVKAY